MTADGLPEGTAERLAAALRSRGVWWAADTDGPTDALLPVVARIVGEARAEAWAELGAVNDAATEDVRAIAVALGLGGHARPYSAHQVVQDEILPAIHRGAER